MWRKAEFEGERIVVDALVRRRAAEKALFLTPTHGWVPAPSPVVRPRVDYDASAAQPRQRPLSLIVPLDGAEAQAHEEPAAEAPVFDDIDERSPATVAAKIVAARLQALAPEPSPEEGTAEAEAGIDLPSPLSTPVDDPSAESQPTVAEAFAPEVEPSPAEPQEEEIAAPSEAADADTRPLPFAGSMDAPSAFSLRPQPASAPAAPRIDEADPSAFDRKPSRPDQRDLNEAMPMRFNHWRLVGLGAAGLVSLGFAMIWALTGGPSAGAFGHWVIAWGAGLAGIACIVGSVYLWLERLGGSED
jgi:lysozyme